MSMITARRATMGDFAAIAKVAVATGQDEEWAGADPAYLAYLLEHGTLLVAERDGSVTGFGTTRLIGDGPAAVSMLCDLFVHRTGPRVPARTASRGAPAVRGRLAPSGHRPVHGV
jgi:hypothetical protein